MHYNRFLILPLLLLILAQVSCGSKDGTKSATSEDAIEQEAEAIAEAPKLPPPPGEPGPVLIRLENRFPTQIFATAANEKWIAMGIQSDIRDITQCPETEIPVCFEGDAVIVERLNPNNPLRLKLYESDTQSGSRIDDVAASSDRFVFALSEGHYVGDTKKNRLAIVDEKAKLERTLDLMSPQYEVTNTVLAPWSDDRILVCSSIEPTSGSPGIRCDALEPKSAKLTPVISMYMRQPVRNLDVAVLGEQALLVWIDSGFAKAVRLDKTDEPLVLGQSTAQEVHAAAGLNEFAVIWQGDDAQMRVDRIPYGQSLKSLERKMILLNGLDYRTVGDLVAISKGYVFAFRHQNTQQMALITPDFSGWHILENSSTWRFMSDYASLDIQEAHTGKILWQTAESLIGLQ